MRTSSMTDAEFRMARCRLGLSPARLATHLEIPCLWSANGETGAVDVPAPVEQAMGRLRMLAAREVSEIVAALSAVDRPDR